MERGVPAPGARLTCSHGGSLPRPGSTISLTLKHRTLTRNDVHQQSRVGVATCASGRCGLADTSVGDMDTTQPVDVKTLPSRIRALTHSRVVSSSGRIKGASVLVGAEAAVDSSPVVRQGAYPVVITRSESAVMRTRLRKP
jgi:hypothetical protein